MTYKSSKMKTYFNIIVLIILVSSFSYSQEEKPETLKCCYSIRLILCRTFNINLMSLRFYRKLNYMKINLPAASDSNSIWMWTKLAISTQVIRMIRQGNSPGDWIEPLHQQFLNDSKFNPVRYVLGMAQTAAVGYLAYQHIKKYGLFK